jgi:hypothetical protein
VAGRSAVRTGSGIAVPPTVTAPLWSTWTATSQIHIEITLHPLNPASLF